jgi:hypothetical protein
MTTFEDIKKQFLPQFRDHNKVLVQFPTVCICHLCPHNHDKHLCPEKCETMGGSEMDCKMSPCQILDQDPRECEKQQYKFGGKPKCPIRKQSI